MKALCLAVALLLAVPCYAGQVQKEIINTTLTKAAPAVEADYGLGDAEKVSFFMTIDNSATTAAITASVTVAASVDGINWTDISWFDVAGGGIPQELETTTGAEQTYVGWRFSSFPTPQIRIRVNATNMSDNPSAYASETATISVTVVEDR